MVPPKTPWYRGECCPFFFTFWRFDVICLNFLARKASANLWKKTGCSYHFQFFVNPKKPSNCCEMLLCFRRGGHNLGVWGSCTPEPGSSCWSKHRSWQQRRCWKYHTWHWHVWLMYPSKNCWKLNHVLTLWINISVTNPQKQANSVRLMVGSCDCQKKPFRFCGFGGKQPSIVSKPFQNTWLLNHYSAWRKSFLYGPCWAWACVALGWDVYIAMHASWCSPACVGHVCGKPSYLQHHHWTSLCSRGWSGANRFALTKKKCMWCNHSNWIL